MREIKLRFYDRRNNVMLYDIESTVYPDGSVGCDMDSEWCVYAGQFTGLKDKNGVEIYEGDILTRKERGCDNSIQSSNYIVFWKESRYMLRTIKSTIFKINSEIYLTDCEYEIVGNVLS